MQSSKGIGEPPLFLGCTVFFAMREAIKAARKMNGQSILGDVGEGAWKLDSPATPEKLRLAVGDDLVKRAEVKREEGETNFFVAVA